ncbi:MAG TPA: hypothetical protein VGH19_16435 [Verrucomicrobiae bacterium]
MITNPYDEAITLLNVRGFYAKRKDSDTESMITVSRGTLKVGFLEAMDGVVYLHWQDGTWDVEAPFVSPEGGVTTPGGCVIEHGYPTTAACERAIKYLQSPVQFSQAIKHQHGRCLEYMYPDCLPLETER